MRSSRHARLHRRAAAATELRQRALDAQCARPRAIAPGDRGCSTVPRQAAQRPTHARCRRSPPPTSAHRACWRRHPHARDPEGRPCCSAAPRCRSSSSSNCAAAIRRPSCRRCSSTSPPRSRQIAAIVAKGALGGHLGAAESRNASGDEQKPLDVLANDAVIQRLRLERAHRRPRLRRNGSSVRDSGRVPARPATCWCSIRSTARRTSTSTWRSARSSRCCATTAQTRRRRRSTTCSRDASRLPPATRSTARRRCWC